MKRLLIALIFTCMMAISYHASAATVTYNFFNIIQNLDGQEMTGSFTWDYTEGDFANGTGTFTELFLPGNEHAISDLNIEFGMGGGEITGIQISLLVNTDSDNVGVSLVLADSLTEFHGSNLDLSLSKYELPEADANPVSNDFYLSGAIVIAPAAVPIPAAIWLFGTGLVGLVAVARRKS